MYCATEDMDADGLTKGLTEAKHKKLLIDLRMAVGGSKKGG